MSSKAGKTQTDLEWENRTLCSDESCIGVIGVDGRCKECGKPFEGELPRTSYFEDTASDLESTIETSEDADRKTRPDPTEEEWENRTLCSDESCIGVIGPDGRCKECGKPFIKASA